jgi:RimJ/RimL family protein N-acetyltransferase
VVSLIRPANERSIRVAESLGEKRAGEVTLNGAVALVYEIRRS